MSGIDGWFGDDPPAGTVGALHIPSPHWMSYSRKIPSERISEVDKTPLARGLFYPAPAQESDWGFLPQTTPSPMPSIADYVRQYCKGETLPVPVQWVWTIHDGAHGVLWTIVHDDGRVLEERHYPNISTAGSMGKPAPARLIGQASLDEMRRFAATLVAQGFDWIQLPLLPASMSGTVSQQIELTVTAGEHRSHLRCPATALERTPRLREISLAFERVVAAATENPPSTREQMSVSPMRAAVEQWRTKQISGTTLMRRLVAYESWYVPIPEAVAAEISNGGSPARVMIHRDADGSRRLVLYSDPAACAQFRWVAAGSGTERQHYLTAEGTWVFRLPLDKVDEIVIDPGTDNELAYSREQFARLRAMASALEMEAALAQLREQPDQLEELLPLIWEYEGYSVAMQNKAGTPPQIAITRDDQGRTLVAIFTFDDCFSAFQAEDARGRYSDEKVAQKALSAQELFKQVADLDAVGIVFNPSGPATSVAFAIEFARIVWEAHNPPLPPVSPPAAEPEPAAVEAPAEAQTAIVETQAAVDTEDGMIFDGQSYVLQYAASDHSMTVNEFLPEGQTSENWSRMLAVRLFTQESDPGEYAHSLETRLKETNPIASSRVSVSPANAEAMLDFLTWADDPTTNAEFNIFRLIRHPRGLLAYQFAFRPAMAGAKGHEYLQHRDRWVELMRGAVFQEPVENQ